MRPKPRAQERPKAFHRIDMHLMKTIPVVVTGIFGLGMIDCFMGIAPGLQLTINGVFIGKNERAGLDSLTHQGLDGLLFDIGEHLNNDLSAALDHAEDGWFFFLKRASPWRSFQASAAPESSLLGRRFWMTLVSSHNVHFITFHFPAQLGGLFFTAMPSRSCVVIFCTTSLSMSNSAAICALDRFSPMKYKHNTHPRNG